MADDGASVADPLDACLDRCLDGANIAADGDKGFAGKAGGGTDFDNINLPCLSGGVGGQDTGGGRVGLDNPKGLNRRENTGAGQGGQDGWMDAGQAEPVDDHIATRSPAHLDCGRYGTGVATDHDQIAARAGWTSGQQFHRRRLDHGVGGEDADGDTVQFNATDGFQ